MAMNKTRRTSNINNIITYDTLGNVTIPADLTVEGLQQAGLVRTDANGLFSVDITAYTTLNSPITGYTIQPAVALLATDTILQAFGKLEGTLNTKYNNPTGTISQYIRGDGSLATFPFIPSGTVTSVGLTMPSAFNVTNSPVTSSGTLTVTGAGLASQYIRGDGTLADLPTIGGGGSSVSYYLNGSINQGTIGDVGYRELSKVPILGTGTDFSTSTNGYIGSFITDVNDPSLLNIPAGNWNFETYFSASSGGGTPTFYVELYKYDGTTFTLIASSSSVPELISFGTNIQPYFSTLAVPQTTLAVTDRLAVMYYVNTSGRTITLHTEDNHLCQIITTFSTGLTALNGLTNQVQFFQTGTSGTDFNISSDTSTHTFNLPTASALNRGLLTSADWTTFNNKQNALTNPVTGTGVSGQVAYWSGTNTQSGSNNFVYSSETLSIQTGTFTTIPLQTTATGLSTARFIGTGVNSGIDVRNTGTLASGRDAQIRLVNGTTFFGANDRTYQLVNVARSATSADFHISYFDGTNYLDRFRIFSSGNFGINTGATDSGQRLQVIGDTLMRGSGNTSATTALTVQNSASSTMMSLSNDAANTTLNISGSTYSIFQANQTTANRSAYFGTSSTIAEFGCGSAMTSYQFLNAGGFGLMRINTTPLPTTGGNLVEIPRAGAPFQPTSGSATFTTLSMQPTINQTGGANGITRGLYVNPTLTSAADWRSIEWSNNSGWGLYGEGSASNFLAGKLGIGSSTLTANTLRISRVQTGATSINTILSSGQINSDVTASVNNFASQLLTQAATFTLGSFSHFRASDTLKGAGSTITNEYGFNVDDLTFGTNSYGFYGNIASGTGRWNLYMNGTALNYMNGALLLGSTTDSGERLQVTGDTRLRGSGNTSATNALTVQNSGSSLLLSVTNNGTTTIRGNSSFDGDNALNVINNANTSILNIWNSGIVFVNRVGGTARFNIGSTTIEETSTIVNFGLRLTTNFTTNTPFSGSSVNFTNPQAITSSGGETFHVNITATLAPTSGGTPYTSLRLNPTINQTGGANGITRGLFVNPTLTAAADWRSIEWSNNTGWGLYGAGTSNNFINGSLFVGSTTPLSTEKFGVYGTNAGGSVFIRIQNSGTTANTSSGIAFNTSTFGGGNVTSSINALGIDTLGNTALSFSNSTTGVFSEKMRLSASGNLLIGSTTDLGERLQVTGTLNVISATSISSANFNFNGNSGGIDVRNTNSLASTRSSQVRLVNGTSFFGANDRSYQIINIGTGTTSADYLIQYWDGTTFNERFRISSIGNILINSTTDSGERLQVNGTMKVTGASTFGGNMTLSLNQNASTTLTIENTTNASNSTSSLVLKSNGFGTAEFSKFSQSRTSYKIIASGDGYIANYGYGDIAILNDFPTGSIKMAAGGSSTAHFTIASTGAATFSSSVTAASFIPTSSTIPTNGMYLSAANTLGFATNGTLDMVIDQNGNVGIGTTSLTNRALAIAKTMSGSVDGYGILQFNTISSGVTTSATNNYSQFATQAASFTLANAYHYFNADISVGAGSTITNQYGYFASAIQSATNNFGFYGNLSSGTGRWNIYMNGTADNYFNGSVGFGTTSPSYRTHINQTKNTTGLFITTDSVNTANDYSQIGFGNLGNGNTVFAAIRSVFDSPLTNSNTSLKFFTTLGTLQERLNIAANGDITMSGRLGVNGLPPTYPLYVKAATNQNFRVVNHGGGATQIAVINDAETAYTSMVLGNDWLNIASTGASTFSSSVTGASFNGATTNIFSVGGTEGMRLTATNRNLHIGTFSSDSGERLQVTGDTRMTGELLLSSSVTSIVNGDFSANLSKVYTPTAGSSNVNSYGLVSNVSYNLTSGAYSGAESFNATAFLSQAVIGGNAATKSTQPIRANIAGLVGISGAAAMNMSDYRFYDVKSPDAAGVSGHVVDNIYGLKIATLKGSSNYTITNGWGIYQEGSSDNNYFNGKVLVGTTAAGSSPMRISGLPTSSAGLSTGDVWNDSGTLKIVL